MTESSRDQMVARAEERLRRAGLSPEKIRGMTRMQRVVLSSHYHDDGRKVTMADILAACEKHGMRYVGDQEDHPAFKRGYMISSTGPSTASRPSTPPSEDSSTGPEQE